jgi:glyoxylase-like metal-dependent hydrolase (beta-lactamase superfamily II)
MKRANKIAGAAALGLMVLLGIALSGKVGAPLAYARDAKDAGAGATAERAADALPEYTIRAIRYATVRGFPLSGLVMGAPDDKKIDIAMVYWVIQGGGRTILFDSGFHREKWIKEFGVVDFMAPDVAVKEAGVAADAVTDIIVSHAHWDHMGGVDLFPNATVWIQRQEYEYYTGAAWQPGGHHGGIDPEDVMELARRNTRGQLRFVEGDDREILPGIRAYTGARHTFASQYILVEGEPAYVLASDNCYLYENLKSHRPSATFDPADWPANLAAQQRMIGLAESAERVVPGHDPQQFVRFPTTGRVAKIK